MRPEILDGLGLTAPAQVHLRGLVGRLDAACAQMTDRLAGAGDSASVRVVPDAGGRTRLSVERPDALEIPRAWSSCVISPRRCCRGSTCPSCCWRCTPGPGSCTPTSTSPATTPESAARQRAIPRASRRLREPITELEGRSLRVFLDAEG